MGERDEGLVGKRILAVDDELDVLEVIEEQLDGVDLVTASDFATARDHIETGNFDLVILDIMGVRGFDLLDAARGKELPAVMLTAHAMTPESLQTAIDKKAVSFLPKTELFRLADLVAEIFEQLEHGQTHWAKLVTRLGPTFREMWGQTWEQIKFPTDTKISW